MYTNHYLTTKDCTSIAKNKSTLQSSSKGLHCIFVTAFSQLDAVDILGSLLTTKNRNWFTIVVNDQLSKLAKIAFSANISAEAIA